MQRVTSNIWSFTATGSLTSLFLLDVATSHVTGSFFDTATHTYIEQTLDNLLQGLPPAQLPDAVERLIARFVSVSALTGDAELRVEVAGSIVEVSVAGTSAGNVVLVQLPHSTALALSPPPYVPETLGYRTVQLGDASTGLWYVTVAARAISAALFGISILKNADLSTPGPLGTFAIDVANLEGLSIYSITAFTYTKAETQAKVLIVLDNPQGPRFAHEVARCSAVQTTTNGSQSMIPIVVVARADGSIPAANGVPHQIDPTESYPRLRISAVGFTAAAENVVTDPAFNKPQTLVVQF